jgi:hypothetical protein
VTIDDIRLAIALIIVSISHIDDSLLGISYLGSCRIHYKVYISLTGMSRGESLLFAPGASLPLIGHIMEKEFNLPPNPDCKFCNGTGEKWVEKHNQGYPCVCLFIDHQYSDELGTMLSETAKKIRIEEFGE